jgi:hypothetical protein
MNWMTVVDVKLVFVAMVAVFWAKGIMAYE